MVASSATTAEQGLQKDLAVVPERVPTDPPFSRSQLRDSIPAHCFERSHARSFFSLAVNLLLVWLTYRVCPLLIAAAPSPAAFFLWPVYWFVQGAFCTGIWVLAHECGHRAFSPSVLVNDTVGLILHSALLVPYHSCMFSCSFHPLLKKKTINFFI
ncbi:MAG: hypothetical protein Q8P67_00020 [archaeon]|nr:hypothetical protein [archaeon]